MGERRIAGGAVDVVVGVVAPGAVLLPAAAPPVVVPSVFVTTLATGSFTQTVTTADYEKCT